MAAPSRICAWRDPSTSAGFLAALGRITGSSSFCTLAPPAPVGERSCHFVGHDESLKTAIYDDAALEPGTQIDGPAIVVTRATTYLIEPGWRYQAAAQAAVWFTRI